MRPSVISGVDPTSAVAASGLKRRSRRGLRSWSPDCTSKVELPAVAEGGAGGNTVSDTVSLLQAAPSSITLAHMPARNAAIVVSHLAASVMSASREQATRRWSQRYLW